LSALSAFINTVVAQKKQLDGFYLVMKKVNRPEEFFLDDQHQILEEKFDLKGSHTLQNPRE